MGVNRRTAILYHHKLREVIAAKLAAEAPFSVGEIEVDESYFGGGRKGKRGRGAAGKVPVFGLLKREGKVYTTMIPDTRSQTLVGIIRERIQPDSLVHTDSYQSYDILDVLDFHHQRINHQNASLTAPTTLMASRTSGTRRSGICDATTPFPRRILTSSSRNASGASTTARRAVC